ncbi:MAG TPA: PaaI family thioesterase [Novosphingobium sp.]|nr:PaaI family thioesterase [Novosphingobium sp.]HZV11564.1 PaaI family thioesterase [Novosphingobium sp.]
MHKPLPAPPPGFRLLNDMDEVTRAFAPLYLRPADNGLVDLGFRVGAQHCNPRGHCHGGTWSTMADILMGLNLAIATGLSGPTVSLTVSFVGPAEVGQWVEGRARVLGHSPRLGFTDCTFSADGVLALRADAVFRRKQPPFRDYQALLAPDD